MSIFKCKMCGGDLKISDETKVVECEYCGTTQTVPNGDDEKKINLFNRANRLRMENEFDKAAGIYESIVSEYPEESEGYWGLVLCAFGIEYVDDAKTGKKIPTCHRTVTSSVMDDDNFAQACENANTTARAVYREEAKEIDRLQKKIISVVEGEEPYDVFICYKETDDVTRARTEDSLIAQDIYTELVKEGYKVFFSRVTLREKAGTEYEPYIYAALKSSKVMLAIGTKYEYYDAVWVKNEWGRYLSMMNEDNEKHLIPCFKNLDAYDIPKEFKNLQALDMGEVTFFKNLAENIARFVPKKAEKGTSVSGGATAVSASATEPLLKRAFMFLEDGDWNSANEYCEKVLDIDPEYAEAYLGKLMAELHVKKQDKLKDQAEPFDDRNNYQKSVRFADEKLKAALTGYIEHIHTRNENTRLDGIYTRAKNAMSAANTESAYKEAAQLFESISEYQDSSALAQSCYEKAEVARKDAILSEGKSKMTGEIISNYESAIKLFESISGWKDADEKVYDCQKKIEEIKAKAEADRLEKERQAEIARKEAERIAKRNKKIAIITTPIVCAIIAFIIVLNTVIIPNGKYNDAIALMDAGKYTEAISAFEALNGYKDSVTKIGECNTAILDTKYNEAISLMDAGKYTEAISAFEALNGYKDSVTKIEECNIAILDGKYNDAIALMNEEKFDEALSIFIELGDYKDAAGIAGDIRVIKLRNAKEGDSIWFGKYEQDNDISNGKEDIEWLVLEVKDGRALVISKYALDCQPYNTSYTDVTWETCTLRKWLNKDFINAAFSADEKAMIPAVTVSADKNPAYGTNSGNATQDQVFLLSIKEVGNYFGFGTRKCKITDYAVANGANVNFSNDNCRWWLRSPGIYQNYAAIVDALGIPSTVGVGVKNNGDFGVAVRPALWIDLNS